MTPAEQLLREAWDKGYLKAKATGDESLHRRLVRLFDGPAAYGPEDNCEHCDGRGLLDAFQIGDGYGGMCMNCDGTGVSR